MAEYLDGIMNSSQKVHSRTDLKIKVPQRNVAKPSATVSIATANPIPVNPAFESVGVSDMQGFVPKPVQKIIDSHQAVDLPPFTPKVVVHEPANISQKAAQAEDVQPPKPLDPVLTPKSNNHTQRLILAMATVLFIAGMFVVVQGFMLNATISVQGNTVSAAQQTNTLEGSEEQPSEVMPDADAKNKYSVALDSPRILTIPKLGVNARVLPLGVDQNNQLQVPTNIYDAGWFTKSAKPGELGGATLLDGHVSGPREKGVFYNLKSLVAGDKITIERGDGEMIVYQVRSKEIIDKDKVDMQKALFSADSSRSGLNIITCTGKYLPAEKTYEKRVVIYAVEL